MGSHASSRMEEGKEWCRSARCPLACLLQSHVLSLLATTKVPFFPRDEEFICPVCTNKKERPSSSQRWVITLASCCLESLFSPAVIPPTSYSTTWYGYLRLRNNLSMWNGFHYNRTCSFQSCYSSGYCQKCGSLSILSVRLHGNIPGFSCSSIRTCFLVCQVDQKSSTRISHLYAWLQPTQTIRLPWQPCPLCENYTPYLADLH